MNEWSHLGICRLFAIPMDCSLTGFSIHGIFQAKVLEWVAISFSRGSSQPRDQTQVFHIAGRLFTLWATKEAKQTNMPFQKGNCLSYSQAISLLAYAFFSVKFSPLTRVDGMLLTISNFQQYVNWEFPDVKAGLRKVNRTRDQISNIHWIIEKAREFQKNIYLGFIDYAKGFDCVDHNKLWKILWDGNARPPYLPTEKYVCRSRSNS